MKRIGLAPAGAILRTVIGSVSYRKGDKVDIAWEVGGQPRVALALEIERDA